LKVAHEPKNRATKADSTPFMGKPSGPNVIDAAEERYIKKLSPELQDVIRKQKEILVLPDWPETTHGVPNICLRSALFRVIRRGRREAVKREIIASIAGLHIRYTGWLLDQGDFDVLAQAFHLQSRHRHMEKTFEEYLRIEIKSFLRSIGRQPGKSGREWLKDCFRRLIATAIEMDIETCHTRTNERIGIIDDPLRQEDLAGLRFFEQIWGNKELLRAQLNRLSIKARLSFLRTADLPSKWERYAYSRYYNLQPGKELPMRTIIEEIQTTFQFLLKKQQILRLHQIRNRVQVVRHREKNAANN
jgi:hypothetical protein